MTLQSQWAPAAGVRSREKLQTDGPGSSMLHLESQDPSGCQIPVPQPPLHSGASSVRAGSFPDAPLGQWRGNKDANCWGLRPSR